MVDNLTNVTNNFVEGTMDATALSITENLTLTVGSDNFLINTGLLSFKSTMKINENASVDVRVCTPPGGIPATVNGSAFLIPTSIWQCLNQPFQRQAFVSVTFVEGC